MNYTGGGVDYRDVAYDTARAQFNEAFGTQCGPFGGATEPDPDRVAEFAEMLIGEQDHTWAAFLYESGLCPDHIADQLHDQFQFGDSVLEGRQRNR